MPDNDIDLRGTICAVERRILWQIFIAVSPSPTHRANLLGFRLYMQTVSKEVLGDLPHHLLMSTLKKDHYSFLNNFRTVSASVKYYSTRNFTISMCNIRLIIDEYTGPRFNKSAHKITKNLIHLKKNTFLQLNISSNKKNIK